MPGAKVWDPTPAGGSLSTARGEQNPSADGASLSSTEVALTRALVSTPGNPDEPGPAVNFFSASGSPIRRLLEADVAAPWGLAIVAPLTHSLLTDFGPLPQFYRAALTGGRPYITDNAGRVHRPVHGECCFYGARRVENLLSNSANFTNAYWTATSSGTVAAVYDSNHPGPQGLQNAFLFTRSTTSGSVLRMVTGVVYRPVRHVFSVWLKAGSSTAAELRIHIAGSTTLATKVVALTTEWQRFAVAGLPNGTNAYVCGVTANSYASTTAGTIYVADAQFEEKIDGSDAPSEYVSASEIPASRYWHGAAVDKVRYFNTAFANTLDGNGLVTEATGAVLTNVMGVMTFPSGIQQILNNDVASGWSATNCTITDNAAVAPDGTTTAMSLDEGTGAGVAHHVQRTLTGVGAISVTAATGGQTWHPFSCYMKKGPSGATWMRLFVQDVGAATLSAYVNLDDGTVGTVSAGHVNVEALADGWYRVMWSVRIYNSSGSADPLVRISMAGGDNTPTYTGTSRVNYIWMPCYHTSTSLSSSAAAQRPIAPPANLTGASVSTLPGQAVGFSVRGILGNTDFAVASTFYPMYRIEQTDKQQYTGTTYIRTEAPQETRGSTVGNLDMQRTGISIRPPLSGGAGNCKFALDFYNGDPNPEYFWQASTVYSVGDYVIPTDTQPNNDNGRQVFTCVVGGTSGGSEPTWNTTYTATPDTTSNLTTDGTVRWQVNVPNGINGTWEPYSGSELLADQGYMGEYKAAWYIRADEYGMFINGVEGYRQTFPRPTFTERGWTLGYRPKTLHLGGLGNNSGQYPEAVPSGQENAVMPVHTAVHRDVLVWHTAPVTSVLAAVTA